MLESDGFQCVSQAFLVIKLFPVYVSDFVLSFRNQKIGFPEFLVVNWMALHGEHPLEDLGRGSQLHEIRGFDKRTPTIEENSIDQVSYL